MRRLPWLLVASLGLVSCSSGGGGSNPSGSGGAAGGGAGGSGGGGRATGGSTTLGTATEVTSVLLPQLNPAWPLGEWDGDLYSPQVVIDCGTSQQTYRQVYDISVTAGAGLDFTADTLIESGAAIGDWTGSLSEDRQSVLVPAKTITFNDASGKPVTTTHDPLTFKLVSASSSELVARLYTSTTSTASSQTCKYQIGDYTLSNTDKRVSNLLQGTTTVTLDAPVALTRWGTFPLAGAGLGLAESSYRHEVTPVLDGGSMPSGIVLDDKAWAVKVATNAIWFYVMVGFRNEGSEATCLYPGRISSVENAANLPVFTDIFSSTAGPAEYNYVFDTVCLRPGDAGWLIGSVSVATNDKAAFTNAAIAKIAPPSTIDPYADAIAPTPYRVRYTPGGGLHVDVIDPADSVRVVFLDDQGLPVGFDESSDSIPSLQSSLQHLVYTFSFAEPAVLGTAKTVLVYAVANPA